MIFQYGVQTVPLVTTAINQPSLIIIVCLCLNYLLICVLGELLNHRGNKLTIF